jgi:prepilin-type processing-associated H-X9-DG protein
MFVRAPNGYGVFIGATGSRPVTYASITDGTSNTMSFSESYVNPNSPINFTPWNTSGSEGYTLFMTIIPPNYPLPGLNDIAAKSFHPGGVTAGFADGSVHFIKNTISCWANGPHASAPAGSYSVDSNGNYNLSATAQLGVWQTISTRANGEVISSDSY